MPIQVRVIRIADQQILAQAIWTGRHTNVLATPQALSEELLARLGKPADPAQLGGIEKQIPRTIDVAMAYYTGMGAFDDGHYPEALAHYLDAARKAGDFMKVYAGDPSLDVYTEGWLVYAMDGDIQIFSRRDPHSNSHVGKIRWLRRKKPLLLTNFSSCHHSLPCNGMEFSQRQKVPLVSE